MKKLRILLVPILVAMILGFTVAPSYAQSSDIVTAEVDRTSLTTDEALVLTIKIDSAAGQASQPVLPGLDGFNVLGTSQSTQISLINGALSRDTVYNYQLQPTHTGDLFIPAISVSVSGRTYNTEPIKVNVTQGNGQGQSPNPTLPTFPSLPGFGQFPRIPNFPSFPNLRSLPSGPSTSSGPVTPLDPSEAPTKLVGQDYFIEGKVDKLQPYQGEQLLYTVRIYHDGSPLNQIEYAAPTFTGFWSEQVPEQSEYTLETTERIYRVTELNTILFPTVVGSLTIDPGTLTIPRSLFSNGRTLQTEPVVLDVQPLPDNAPADFRGAVGQYSITADTDATRLATDETVTLRITISGAGNLNNLPDPKWSEGADWRAFDSQANVTTRIENNILLGERIYDRVLVPTASGSVEIPTISYSYFDPASVSYETVQTEAISIEVMPGTAVVQDPAPVLIGTNTNTGSTQRLRPLKAPTSTWLRSSTQLPQQIAYWLLWGIPLFFIAGNVGWKRYQSYKAEKAPGRLIRQAARQARIELRQAAETSDSDFEAAGDILNKYLATRLDINLDGLTHTALAQQLTVAGVTPELAALVQEIRLQSEMGRYAPSGAYSQVENTLGTTSRVIDELEEALQ